MSAPVTGADVLAAYEAFYARAGEFAHIPVVPPLVGPDGVELLAAIKRALECDRARVAAARLIPYPPPAIGCPTQVLDVTVEVAQRG